MKITDIRTHKLSIPLVRPFKTALRTVTHAESVIVYIICGDGTAGLGEAVPTSVITGESSESINYAIMHVFRPLLIGRDIEQKERMNEILEKAMVHNSSARAAVDMALFDCLGKRAGMPLYQLLGGYRDRLETDYTVSMNGTDEMVRDAEALIEQGFDTLKIKVGHAAAEEDIGRVADIRRAVGNRVKLRLDANQGWNAKEAILAIRRMEEMGLDIELVEQPVPAWDFEGMRQVTSGVTTPIMADESVFGPRDAARLLSMHGCDAINIKLMKAGGISGAEKINTLAETYGIECMVGCMIESRVSVTAACHFAAARRNVTRFDFDAPLMFAAEPVKGGIRFKRNQIFLPKTPGLGIDTVQFGP